MVFWVIPSGYAYGRPRNAAVCGCAARAKDHNTAVMQCLLFLGVRRKKGSLPKYLACTHQLAEFRPSPSEAFRSNWKEPTSIRYGVHIWIQTSRLRVASLSLRKGQGRAMNGPFQHEADMQPS